MGGIRRQAQAAAVRTAMGVVTVMVPCMAMASIEVKNSRINRIKMETPAPIEMRVAVRKNRLPRRVLLPLLPPLLVRKRARFMRMAALPHPPLRTPMRPPCQALMAMAAVHMPVRAANRHRMVVVVRTRIVREKGAARRTPRRRMDSSGTMPIQWLHKPRMEMGTPLCATGTMRNAIKQVNIALLHRQHRHLSNSNSNSNHWQRLMRERLPRAMRRKR